MGFDIRTSLRQRDRSSAEDDCYERTMIIMCAVCGFNMRRALYEAWPYQMEAASWSL